MATWQAINWTGRAATTVVVDDANTLSGKHVIAECDTAEHASLLAAAPELLAALELLTDRMFQIPPGADVVLDAARAAIAKATEQQGVGSAPQ